MIVGFADSGTRDVWDGADSKAARRSCPEGLWPVARRKLDMLHAAVRLGDLMSPPANHLEKLKGALSGKHSIRVNRQYRIVFEWDGANAREVELVDYH